MTKFALAVSLIALYQVAATTPASAAQCAERSYVVGELKDRFGETLQSRHRRGNAVLEVYASRRTNSWTLMMSFKEGLSCIVSSGEGFSTMGQSLQGRIPRTSRG